MKIVEIIGSFNLFLIVKWTTVTSFNSTLYLLYNLIYFIKTQFFPSTDEHLMIETRVKDKIK